MVYFSKQDMILMNIPFKQRECYTFETDFGTYVCFDPEYIFRNVHILKNIQLKRLENTNYLFVPFKAKMIADAVNKIFKLTDPVENKKDTKKKRRNYHAI